MKRCEEGIEDEEENDYSDEEDDDDQNEGCHHHFHSMPNNMSSNEFYEFMFFDLFHEHLRAQVSNFVWNQQFAEYIRQRAATAERERQQGEKKEKERRAHLAKKQARNPLGTASVSAIKTCHRCQERYLSKVDQRCEACGVAEPELQKRLVEERERAKALKKEKQSTFKKKDT